LVVDDDAEIRLLLNELLSRAGFQVEEAVDGKSALRKLFETPPALVILDVTMPEMDGYQTLDRIRDLSDVPVTMFTARSHEPERVRRPASAPDDYAPKPFARQQPPAPRSSSASAVSPPARTTTFRSRSAGKSCWREYRHSFAAAVARPR